MFSPSFLTIIALGLLSTSNALPGTPLGPRRQDRDVVLEARAAATAISSVVYKTSTYSLSGCYQDSASTRLLTGSYRGSAALAPGACVRLCADQGFKISGVESGFQCFCGNSLDATKKVADSRCDVTCNGDAKSLCGGDGFLNAYNLVSAPVSTSSSAVKTTTVKPVSSTSKAASSTTPIAPTTTKTSVPAITSVVYKSSTYTLSGCYQDSASTRLLTGSYRGSAAMAPGACVGLCADQGFKISGVESGFQCFCGNSLDATKKVADSRCDVACSGDAKTLCGGNGFLNAYNLVPAPVSTSAVITTTVKPVSSTSKSAPAPSGTAPGCIGACDAEIGAPAPAAGARAALYAHHMVGNTYSYTQATWADDVALAAGAGIDGFALNFGNFDWQYPRIDQAYAAAGAYGNNFKTFLSFDMTVVPCTSAQNAIDHAKLIAKYANSTSQATFMSKTLVSTFSGEYCTYGQSNLTQGWGYLRTQLRALGVEMFLVPALFMEPSQFAANPWFDGEFNWDSGWPVGDAKTKDLTTASDLAYMTALGSRSYMASISPNFFTYYGPSSWNKNWIYRADGWLLARRMEQLIQMRNKVRLAEIVSWNDYGESHYIGPIRADQPNSQGWTNGMPHTAWLQLIAYYAPAYKTGAYPRITQDSMFLWSRPHPNDANPTNPTNARPTNWQYTDDNLYAVVLLTAPATVTITSGTNKGTWSLPAGLSKLSLANQPGSIGGKIVRGSTTVKTYDSGDSFVYTTRPVDYNYNYFVAQA